MLLITWKPLEPFQRGADMPNKIRRAVMAALPLAFAFSLASPGSAWAQPAAPDPLVHLTPVQASTFFSAFTALSQQGQIMIVAEDQPLYPTLASLVSQSPARRAAAALTLKKEGEPLSTLLPKIAAAYDYDVQLSGKVFLLRKRYTDAADLPSITVKECALALEETNRYAENFNPHLLDLVDRSPAISDLIYSLTPEQLEAMKDIHRGVLVASLSPEHQQEVQQFLLHMYVQRAIADLPKTISGINRIAAIDPQFSWRDCATFSNPLFARRYLGSNIRLFGYDAARADGKPLFITMSKPDQMKVDLDGTIRVTPRPEEGVPQVAGQFALGDASDPAPVPANAPIPLVSSPLGDILTQMNVRAADGLKGDGLKVTVEPYLAPKRATVFGEAQATPRQEVAALADVYGLRILTGEKVQGHDRLRVTRLTPGAPLDVAALSDVLRQFLPDPLIRASRMHPTYGYFVPDPQINSGTSRLLVYAVKQIRTAAEPKIRASKDGRVALSALSEREGRAFAMTLMVDAMDSLRDLLSAEPPKELTQFNALRLSGGLYDDKSGKKRLTLLLALPNPNDPSTLLQGMGAGEINYDPVNHTF